jgi:hypothetical protein
MTTRAPHACLSSEASAGQQNADSADIADGSAAGDVGAPVLAFGNQNVRAVLVELRSREGVRSDAASSSPELRSAPAGCDEVAPDVPRAACTVPVGRRLPVAPSVLSDLLPST